jgi:Tfp pilus assembly protein PilF
MVAAVWPAAANANESSGAIKNGEEYLAKGDLKAAEIELKNAIRQSPQDPLLRVRLAQAYLQLGDPASAKIAARAAKERNSEEADYLPVLAEALLQRDKFQEVVDLIQPGDRAPALESKARSALGLAALGLHDQDKADQMYRDAIQLDPSAAAPKTQLARLLAGKNPRDADKLIDEALAVDPQSTEVLLAKGEMLRARGNLDGAVGLFQQVIKIDPKNLSARLNRANINIAEGKFNAVDEDLDPILKAAPKQLCGQLPEGFGARQPTTICGGRPAIRPSQSRVPQILVGVLPPGGGENGAGTIRPGGKHTGQIRIAFALRPAGAASDGQRCVATARSITRDRVFGAAGGQIDDRRGHAERSRKCVYG